MSGVRQAAQALLGAVVRADTCGTKVPERYLEALRTALAVDTVEVPRGALVPILNRWANCKARYERVGSTHHLQMPGHWPFNVEFTMNDVRDIVAAAEQMADKP